MSKYSNSIGLRLGLFQLWNITLNTYNINYKTYSKLLFAIVRVKNYFIILQKKFNFFGVFFNCTYYSTHLVLIVYYLNPQELKSQIAFYTIFKKISFSMFYWIKTPVFIIYYSQKIWLNSAFLTLAYIRFIFNQTKFSLKVILKKLNSNLLDQINKKIVYSNISGIKYNKIKGIKFCCKGRLGTSRNPLTQTLKKTFGSLPLPKINGHLDYVQDIILTKRGTFGVQILIFSSCL